MQIRQLRLTNFKSYSGCHKIGPLDSHFSCIVGPNGNGKSNIIDAVLFVFGFKTSKLRQDRLPSLIHTSAVFRADNCEVAIVFAEKEGRQSQVLTEISRTIRRSGANYYCYNKQKISWGQLKEKFGEKRIDLDRPLFIVLQGEIERLCELSPKQLVDHMEYVTNSIRFKEEIEQKSNMLVENNKKKEVVRELLGRNKREFLKIQEVVEAMTRWMKGKIKLMCIQYLVGKKAIVLGEKEKEQIVAVEKKEEEIRHKNDVQIKQYTKINKGIKKELVYIFEVIRSIEMELVEKQNKLDKQNCKFKEILIKKSFLVKDKNNYQEQISRCNKQICQIYQMQKKYSQIYAQSCSKLNKIEKLFTKANLNKYKIYKQFQQKIENLIRQRQKNIFQINQIKTKTEQSQDLQQTKQLELKNLMKQKQQIANKILYLKTSMLKLKQESTKSQMKLKSFQYRLRQTKINSNVRPISTRDFSLYLPDITIFTLRDKITIQDHFDIVQTVLNHLDSFIVNTYRQAALIIEVAKKHKLGRVTVLIKELILKTNQEIKQLIPFLKAKRVFDLIKCQQKDIQQVLYYLLGDTMLAQTLDVAMKIGFQKRVRVITLQGELIQASGTMTKITLKSFVQNKEKILDNMHFEEKIGRQIKQQMEEESKKVQEMQYKLQRIKKQISQIQNIRKINLKYGKKQKENYAKEIDNYNLLNNQINNQIKKIEQNLKKIKYSIQNQYNGQNKFQEIFQQKLQKIKQYEIINNKIKKLQASKPIIQNLQTIITTKQTSLKLLEKDIQNNQQQNEIQQQKINTIQISIIEIQNKLKNKKDQKNNLQKSSFYYESQIIKIEDMNKKNKLQQIKEQLKIMETSQQQLKQKNVTLFQEIKDFQLLFAQKIYPQLPHLMEQSIFNPDFFKLGANELSFSSLITKQQRQILNIKDNNLQLSSFLLNSIQIKRLNSLYKIEQKQLDSNLCFQEINFKHFQDYKKAKIEYQLSELAYNELQSKQQKLCNQLQNIKKHRLEKFIQGFSTINNYLSEIYKRLTGGNADMCFVDPLDPFEGIQFSVRPVNKTWKRVNLLSGGQKTFTSLALIFACQRLLQFPFYFMDEIDAALDYRNTSLLAAYIRNNSARQHIVVSLRKNMYQDAQKLIGVYKVEDQSNILQLKMVDITKKQI